MASVGAVNYSPRVDDNLAAGAEATVGGVRVYELEPQEVRDGRVRRLLPGWMSPAGGPWASRGALSVTASPHSALPALTVRRGRKGLGRYLKESKVLLLANEGDRTVAILALEAEGFEVLHP